MVFLMRQKKLSGGADCETGRQSTLCLRLRHSLAPVLCVLRTRRAKTTQLNADDGEKIVHMHDWEAFCTLFIKTG